MRKRFFAVAVSFACAAPAAAAPTFVLGDLGGTGPDTAAGRTIALAVDHWARNFGNDVTIRLNFGFARLPSNVLGSSEVTASRQSYQNVRRALQTDPTGWDEAATYDRLEPTLSFLSNEAGNCERFINCGRISSTTRVIDNDATTDNLMLQVPTALAKALELAPDDGIVDATILFNNRFAWDVSGSFGVHPKQYDLLSTAIHEIGHALGFVSGVDFVDTRIDRGGSMLDFSSWGTPLDLFRYEDGVRAWTVGQDTTGTAPCLAYYDYWGQLTCLGALSTGVRAGDGRQASHWKNGLSLGAMNPTLRTGRRVLVSSTDVLALDLIGWDTGGGYNPLSIGWGTAPAPSSFNIILSQTAVPAPAGLALFGLGVTAAALLRRRR